MRTALNSGERIHVRNGYPSDHDFILMRAAIEEILAILDKLRKKLDSNVARETIFHIRGFILFEMGEVEEFIRPRE